MKFCIDIHVQQKMNPYSFGDSLTLTIVPPWCLFVFLSEISRTTGWIVMEFSKYYTPFKVNCSNIDVLLIFIYQMLMEFPSVLSCTLCVVPNSKCQHANTLNCLDKCEKKLYLLKICILVCPVSEITSVKVDF